MSSTSKKKTYQELQTELDELLTSLQVVEDVDEIMQRYTRGKAIITELQAMLSDAKNTVIAIAKAG